MGVNRMDDTISRQLAVDELIKMLVDCFQADEELVDAVVTTIKDLPAAQPEPTMEEFMYGQDMGNPEDGSL